MRIRKRHSLTHLLGRGEGRAVAGGDLASFGHCSVWCLNLVLETVQCPSTSAPGFCEHGLGAASRLSSTVLFSSTSAAGPQAAVHCQGSWKLGPTACAFHTTGRLRFCTPCHDHLWVSPAPLAPQPSTFAGLFCFLV